MALARVAGARTVVLVEGVSDQIAVETLAAAARPGPGRRGRGGAAHGRRPRRSAATCGASAPTGPAHGSPGSATRARRTSSGAGWPRPGFAQPGSRADLERLGFFTCVEDLEDELIRAAGPALVTELFAAHGDLRAFRTIQRQPAWRGRREAAQLRRFLGAGAQRKSRYARLLTEAIDLDQVPRPLTGLLLPPV